MSLDKRYRDKVRRIAVALLKQNPGLDREQLGDELRSWLLRAGLTWDTQLIKDAADRAVHPEYYTRPKIGTGWS